LITIDLQARFNVQARAYHLRRMHVLLSSLDLDQSYSLKPDFTESISAAIDLLEAHDVTQAYSQACVLLSLFAGQVSIQGISSEADPQTNVLRSMQQALSAGVSPSAFHCLYESLAGLGRFDQPWPSGQLQINLIDLLAAVQMGSQPTKIPCNQTGSLAIGVSTIAGELVNWFRTDSGFVHQVFGQFTPDYLIAQVCKNSLPANDLVIHVDPVFERCEIGRQNTSGFFSLQRMELIDTRLTQLDFKQLSLSCSPEEKQGLQSRWSDSGVLIEPVVQQSNSWLSTDLNFRAQWTIHEGLIEFVTTADMQLRAAADDFKWQAQLIHNHVPVNLSIQTERDIHVHWQHSEKQLPGLLPLGEPLWLAQYRVPLHVQVCSVVGVGKPLIRAASPLAGELVFSVSAVVNPEDRALEVVLTVDHSELICDWQSVDPVKGWALGCWHLAAPARIMQRGLQHG
jgi:hypothetical protein